VEYAWRHAGDYSLVWWVEAEQAGLLAGQVAALGARLGLPATGRVDQDAAGVLGWLSRADGWLVIFDNAPGLDAVRSWLPAGNGHVLITSRNPAWGAIAVRIEVDVLAREESVSFLEKHVPGMQPETADDLAAELGDLPLALGQAAGYLEVSGIQAGTYLARFRQRRAQMLARGADLVYGGSLDTAWAVTLDRLQADAPKAVALLELAAFCAPEPIPLSLFLAGPGLLPAPLPAAMQDSPDLAIDDAVTAALAYSLCRRDGDTVQVHRLVQAVISARLPPQRRAAVAATLARLLAAASPGHPDAPATWPAWAALAPHIIRAWTAAQPDDRITLSGVARSYSWYLFTSGDLDAARQLAAILYEAHKSADGPDSDRALTAEVNLATILSATGERSAATALTRHVLERRRQALGDDHPDTLHATSCLASRLSEQGQWEAARDLAEDGLQRCRRILGPDGNLTLATAETLAESLSALGEEGALDLAADTVARWRQLVGDDHRETMWAVGVLIDIMVADGETGQAHMLAAESLARHRRLFGEAHHSTRAAADRYARAQASLHDRQSPVTRSAEDPPEPTDRLRARHDTQPAPAAIHGEHQPAPTQRPVGCFPRRAAPRLYPAQIGAQATASSTRSSWAGTGSWAPG